ncbi:ABC transporter permease [Kineosporia sp. J2-2]|uniref:ABC transporter permease n=1 Tax=Kineosporia corallincola TaxID=2835133 RepID=A0ABS5TN96_9ACTN|nr:ABC transporter permease [Kineosporia corallincola]MBT0772566.1 ABC transporter permease [Kineosporia corallincola]
MNSFRAELLRLRRWPAIWVTLGAWIFLALLFGYVFNYVTYTSGGGNFSNEGQSLAQIYVQLLPEALPGVLVQGMPLFGGALMMVLGAIVAGNGYGYGTWKTIYTQGPSRRAVTLGSLLALSALVVGVLLLTLALFGACTTAIALSEGEALVWPPLTDLAAAVGAGLLVLEMWAPAGYFLGTAARGPALWVGLGLVWALVIEQLLRGVGGLLGPVEAATRVLPGTAAGSLAGAIVGPGGDTPGVLDVLSGPVAAASVTGYLVVLVTATVVLAQRRDVV